MKRLMISRCVDRVEFFKSVCAGKTVLHLGCANAGLTETKLADGSLLHLSLGSVTQALYGIDFDAKGIEIMRSYGIHQLLVGDCEHLDRLDLGTRFDVILAANMFNCLPNPGKFLEMCKNHLKPDGELAISVENEYSIKRILRKVLMRRDVDHPCHLWDASPVTLEHLLTRIGYIVAELCSFWLGSDVFAKQTLRSKCANHLFSRLPGSSNYADGLIVRARPGYSET